MLKTRLIAVVIVRDGQVVQSVKFQHTNVIHYDPIHAVECFSRWSVDEIVVLNVSKNEDSRDNFSDVVKNFSEQCFVPLTAGGWIVDESHAQQLLRSGADKLVLNTALHDHPELMTRLSSRYGKQCMVASIDVKSEADTTVVMVDRGTRVASRDVVAWCKNAVELGAGEIFFNSIDHDGARRGYNLDILAKICDAVDVPVIAFGGVFRWKHLVEGVNVGAAAVAAANIFHYTEQATKKAKRHMAEAGVPVRKEGQSQ